jgi:hypothetical protein
MANWHFATPLVTEAPMAWNPLHERYRMDRGVTVHQTAPGPNYTTTRYDAYTNELGAANLPVSTDHQFPETGLNVFRGGYDWIVNDATKADLINSGIGITNANFTPAP